CQAITYRFWAEHLGISLDKLTVRVEGDLDIRGFFGFNDSVRPGFSAVRVQIGITGPETPERYQELAAAVDEHCPVLDLFRNPVRVDRTIAVGLPCWPASPMRTQQEVLVDLSCRALSGG